MTQSESEGLLGAVLDGKYRIESPIGIGGFGVVYRATHLSLKRPVAVKVLHANVSNATLEDIERFRMEGVSATRIEHPNAVTILDFGTTANGYAYLVMELLEGHLLSDELKDKGKLTVQRCIEIIIPVCDVLAEAHAAGIVHRDIKPDNIYLHRTRRGEVVKVLDFGIAKIVGAASAVSGRTLTASGVVMGTPEYMAPERMRNKPYDGRSDVYSLGVVIHQVLTGALPFSSQDGDYVAVMWMHVNDPPPPLRSIEPDIPESIEALVLRMLEKDPERRPTAAELANELVLASGFHQDFPGLELAGSQTISDDAEGTFEGLWGDPLVLEVPPLPPPTLLPEQELVLAVEALLEPVPESPPAVDLPSRIILLDTPPNKPAPRFRAEIVGEIRCFEGHNFFPSIAFSADGSFFLSAHQGRVITVWEVKTGEELRRFSCGRNFPLQSVVLSPDGVSALLCGVDQVPRLWDIVEGREMRKFTGHQQVTCLAFSPDGTRVLSGSQDSSLYLWEAATGGVVHRLSGHTDTVAWVSFAPDGGHAVSMGLNGDLHYWDLREGRMLRRFGFAGVSYDAFSIAVFTDGRRVIGDEEGGSRPGDVERTRPTHRLRFEANSHSYRRAAFDPTGRLILSSSHDTTARLWDIGTGLEVRSFRGHGNYVGPVAFSPDGTRALTGSDDRTIRLWNVADGQELYCFQGHRDKIHNLMLLPDGSHALSSSQDGTVRLWGLPD